MNISLISFHQNKQVKKAKVSLFPSRYSVSDFDLHHKSFFKLEGENIWEVQSPTSDLGA